MIRVDCVSQCHVYPLVLLLPCEPSHDDTRRLKPSPFSGTREHHALQCTTSPLSLSTASFKRSMLQTCIMGNLVAFATCNDEIKNMLPGAGTDLLVLYFAGWYEISSRLCAKTLESQTLRKQQDQYCDTLLSLSCQCYIHVSSLYLYALGTCHYL